MQTIYTKRQRIHVQYSTLAGLYFVVLFKCCGRAGDISISSMAIQPKSAIHSLKEKMWNNRIDVYPDDTYWLFTL